MSFLLPLPVPGCLGVVQSLGRVRLSATPWTVAHQAPLSSTASGSLLKFMPIASVMPSHHRILCCLLLLSPSVFLNIRVFSNELVFHIRWPKYWCFSFSISPSNEYSGLIFFRIDCVRSPCCQRDTVQKHHFFSSQPSSLSNSHTCT